MDVAIVVFTRDLRVHDNPALTSAVARARQVVPLFVVDPALAVPQNRARFLADSLAALRAGLRDLGGDLVIRRGDPVAEVIALATLTNAEAVFIAGDASRYAGHRQQRLNRECATHRIALEVTPGHAVVPPGDLRPVRRRPLPGVHPVLARLAGRRLAAAVPGPVRRPRPGGHQPR